MISKSLALPLCLAASLLAGTSQALPVERNLAPPARGPYLAWNHALSVNNAQVDGSVAVGWREEIFDCTKPWLDYNFIGMEFIGDAHLGQLGIGSRMILQPTSFLSGALAYNRIWFPGGVVSFQQHPDWSEGEYLRRMTDEMDFDLGTWADAFQGRLSIHKEIGALQFRFPIEWTRIDIDDPRDSLYVPQYDLLSRNRDDILRLDQNIGYKFNKPILMGVGLAHSIGYSTHHEIMRRRAGVWMQIWPFSRRNGGQARYWSVRGRVDVWTRHEYKKYEPRLELSIAWERNLFNETSELAAPRAAEELTTFNEKSP